MTTYNTVGLHIDKPATNNSSYDGGLRVTRNASTVVGGLHGFVNTTTYINAVVGKHVTAFEWPLTVVLENHADAGENVAAYLRADKYGKGPTWSLVNEVTDHTEHGAVVAQETNVNVTGWDNGLRIGLDLIVQDAAEKIGQKSEHSEATAAIRITARDGSSWTRGIMLVGKSVVGVDMSHATLQTALRLKPGQRISFDNYDQTGVRLDPETWDLVFDRGGIPLMRLSPAGDLTIAGRLHQAPLQPA